MQAVIARFTDIPLEFKARFASKRVAPVVTKSSTKKISFEICGPSNLNAPEMFRLRSIALNLLWSNNPLVISIPENIDKPVCFATSAVNDWMKSRPRFLMARLDPGIGTKAAFLKRCGGIRFITLTRASIIIRSALFTDDSLALNKIDLAIGEYLIDE
jgi:hypothetical protein